MADGLPEVSPGLTERLEAPRAEVLALKKVIEEEEVRQRARIDAALPKHRQSAANLAHYLGLRKQDIRSLQLELAALGLSSLGRCEGHVRDTLLRLCEVLDSVTHTGLPTRAEVTDAAMAMRAECVMLNKGLHIGAAVRMLADIIRKMETHQYKKRALYRPLSVARGGP